ncbi:hypothetical protein [Acetobacter fallax]|uniref:Uncharacterized protein n=1 Tax=Acetobacter fallax TaxID=1737473 RepID=A0ABX0KEM0_9PROT|nr:hypothetical protein [Acetobacter fallax]NHO32387.1 hypothetical protein [Acetobacter fallax]NHO35945.1 hypothetical protein [Acetobacter fallax]
MTTISNLSGTSYALLAMQHKARTSGAPAALGNTNISATGKRAHGSSVSIGLDATGNVITTASHNKADKQSSSASVNLFG